jgi:hypothetical protein
MQIKPYLKEIANNQFGNYLIQKIISVLPEDQIEGLIKIVLLLIR